MTKIIDFFQIVDDIYGVYLDSTNGFCVIKRDIESIQRNSNRKFNTSIQNLDNRKIFYGKGDPSKQDSYPLHVCTQGEFKKRNKVDGENYKIIANLCIVQIYQYWEDHYREEIADEFGQAKNALESDIMGDLKHFRNSIIHHRGVAIKDIKKCKILNWYQGGEVINIDKEKFEEIIRYIKNWINMLKAKNFKVVS